MTTERPSGLPMVLAGLCVGLGLIVGGYLLGASFTASRMAERTVSVKGLAEREVDDAAHAVVVEQMGHAYHWATPMRRGNRQPESKRRNDVSGRMRKMPLARTVAAVLTGSTTSNFGQVRTASVANFNAKPRSPICTQRRAR